MALAVSTQRVKLDFVSTLLNDPDHGWDGKVTPAPAKGLYLAKVNYKEEALKYATDDYEVMKGLEKVPYDPDFVFKGENEVKSNVCDES